MHRSYRKKLKMSRLTRKRNRSNEKSMGTPPLLQSRKHLAMPRQTEQIQTRAEENFLAIRDIPYSIPLAYGAVDHCCSGKNKMLKNSLEELGYTVRWRVCSFRWSDIDLPEKVKSVRHDNDSTHAYLEFEKDSEWRTVDATWDKGIGKIFPVEEWSGTSSTGIAVKPVETFSPEKSEEIMRDDSQQTIESDLAVNGNFYQAFNEWLVELRSYAE